jgi:hypothetical protein
MYRPFPTVSAAFEETAVARWSDLVDDICGTLPSGEYEPDDTTRRMMAILIELAVTEAGQESPPGHSTGQ